LTVKLVLGRYELYGAIARGGMATVHLGRLRGAEGFHRVVAIKRLHPELARDPDVVAMFIDEAHLASQIHHPNVVPVLDVVAEERELFLVMEYVEGEPLARIARPVPPAIASSLFVGALSGLHAAHEAKDGSGRALEIVHRDVSPQNVLVGADGLAHVVDFGVAKAVGRVHMTRDGAVRGKLPYMAPEQLRAEKVTRLADVYGAAATLWGALAGRRLFDAPTDAELLLQVLEANVPPPSAHVPGLSAAVDAVVMRGLARDRTRRYPTARAMAEDLARALPPAPVSAVADWFEEVAGASVARRARLLLESTPPRRRWRLVALGGAIAACAAIGLVLASNGDARPSPVAPRVRDGQRKSLEGPSSEDLVLPALPQARRKLAPACDPPYAIEAGHKVFKPGCL
jgi:serine/threonine-protein kinase